MSFRESKDGWPIFDGSNEPRRLPKLKRPVEVEIADIVLGNGGRALNFSKVKQFERSIEDQGFLQPIHVFKLRAPHVGKFGLAAGQHRLRALINLGFTNVPAIIISRKRAKSWRHSENLHRNDLRALRRSEDIVAYARYRRTLPNVNAGTKINGGKQPRDRGYRKLAAITGFDRKRIAEAYRHASLPDPVKKVVRRKLKLNNRRTLNALAAMETEREQMKYVMERTEGTISGTGQNRQKKLVDTHTSRDALGDLMAAWKISNVRKLFRRQTAVVRRKFVQKLLT